MILEYSKKEIKNYLESNKVILDNGCWVLETRNTNRYQYYLGIGIHRLSAWIFNNFDIDSKLLILHKCDNPPCWNPEHLNSGNQSENINDALNKKGIWNIKKSKPKFCKRGHEFTLENTYKNAGGRRCLRCRKEYYKPKI